MPASRCCSCWASGFVVPRAFERTSEPLTFVALRNAGALVVLVAIAIRHPWPRKPADIAGLLWSGALLQGFSIGLLYWAVYHGLPAGIGALIGGLQPAIVAMLGVFMLGEMLGGLQWTGIAIGLAGVALVVSPKLAATAGASLGLIAAAFAGVASMAYGSLYQKRFAHTGDAWTRTALLFAGAFIPPLIGALALEHGDVNWQPVLIAVYAWSVLALAVGATMALLFLIQRGEAARASSLIYLVPPVSATMAYFAFGETISAIQIAGFVVTAIGVVLVQRKAKSAK
ncbi:DMT family transporter [Rhodoplanes sp. Z2-YC6860]|uniref:DMT family transporter n=1 Tax=Rhodoplanes sp. Z2-YC6860 TaxID=674703 RepID=UPI000A074422|nr:DMT family transporter [Rhodoplanes sp. Z2-YC6860]